MTMYAPRTSTAAVAKAKSWVGKSYPAGWCQKWTVGEIFGTGGVGDWDGDGAADAEDGWKAAVRNGRVVHARDIVQYNEIPAGVALYWTGGRNDHGHACVSAGDGYIYTTDLPTSGRIGKVRLEEVNRRWGLTFAGYVLVTGNGYTLTDKPTGPVDRMDPANYGPGKSGPHILWYGQRLEAHGFGEDYTPTEDWGPADVRQTAAFQRSIPELADDADGLPGRRTLELLAANPSEAPVTKPSDILDLSCWKLQANGVDIKQPALDSHSSWRMGVSGTGVAFRARVSDNTTSGSVYPRSELREMKPGGKTNASWDTRTGKHTLAATVAIGRFPKNRPTDVIGQVHNGSDDVVRLLGKLRSDGSVDLVASYGLGKGNGSIDKAVGRVRQGQRFTYRIRAAGGVVYVDINGVEKAKRAAATSGCFYKAGVYVISNEDYDAATEYGGVVIYNLEVSHA